MVVTEDHVVAPPPEQRLAGARALQRLLDAVLAVLAEQEPASVQRRILRSAVDLTGAGGGALALLDPDGGEPVAVLRTGPDGTAHDRCVRLPPEDGPLRALLATAGPVRLAQLGGSVPVLGASAATSYLGMPVRAGGAVVASLHLTGKRGAEVFSDIDEELVGALASAAGIALENARRLARRRETAIGSRRAVHDDLVNDLLGAGFEVRAAAAGLDGPVGDRLDRVASLLDDAVARVRHLAISTGADA